MTIPGNNFPGVKALVDVLGDLEGFDFGLMLRLLREGVTPEQLRKFYWEDPRYLFLAPVIQVVDLKFFTFMWRGRILWGRAIPDTSSLSEGDEVLMRFLPGSKEYVTIIEQQALVCAPGINGFGAGSTADLWIRNNATATWSQLCAVPIPADDPGTDESTSQRYFSLVFWWPEKRKVYGITCDGSHITGHPKPEIYEINIGTGVATSLQQRDNLQPLLVSPEVYFHSVALLGNNAYFCNSAPTSSIGSAHGKVTRFDGVLAQQVYNFTFAPVFQSCVIASDGTQLIAMCNSNESGRRSIDGITWANYSTAAAGGFPTRMLYGRAKTDGLPFLLASVDLSPPGQDTWAAVYENRIVPGPSHWDEDEYINNPSHDRGLVRSIGTAYRRTQPHTEFVFFHHVVTQVGAIPTTPEMQVWYRDASSKGAYTQDTNLPALAASNVAWVGKLFASLGGRVFFLGLAADNHIKIFSRQLTGTTWTIEHDFGELGSPYYLNTHSTGANPFNPPREGPHGSDGGEANVGLYELGLPFDPSHL